ncbi:hypothetical protein, partial [Burkholderia pseudomallei]
MSVDVDSDARLLLVVARPVDSEPIELSADEKLVEVDVESEAIELVVDERPVDVEVDSEARLLSVVLRP